MKALLIEDNIALAESILHLLKQSGHICEHASTFILADEKIELYEYDCIIIDITLPDGNGLKLLEKIKKMRSKSGTIIISAKNSLDDKINGLDLGADDYITKPFYLAELNSRIKSVMRRKQNDGQALIEFNEIKIQPEAQSVLINDQSVILTKKEFDLLLFFIVNKNRVITKESLAEHLWGDDIDLSNSFDFIYTHIKNLRKKMIDHGGKDYIKTIYATGYKFSEQ